MHEQGWGVVQAFPWSARRVMHVVAKEEVPPGMGDVDIRRLLLRVSGGSSQVNRSFRVLVIL